MKDVESRIRDGIRSAVASGKPVMFPKARSFVELFLDAHAIADLSPGRYRPKAVHRFGDPGREGTVSSFCSVSDGAALDVTPRSPVLLGIQAAMLPAYRIDFKVVVRPDGTALVAACYGEILGDRWLAIVDPQSVPGRARPRSAQRCSSCKKRGHNSRTCAVSRVPA
jgi:hypothetical protein